MLAAVLAGPCHFELREEPIPEPGPRQVRVRLEGCGVGASNILPWEGRPWFQYPFSAGSPGHEGWGRIDALGSDVTGVTVGERVGMLSTNAFAQYDLAEKGALVRLPESMDGQPFPAEPLGGVVNVFRRSLMAKGDRVAIVGIGFLGALLAQLAAAAQARVVAIGRRPCSLAMAKRMGAEHAIAADAAREANDGERFDIVIEAAGKPEALSLAGELTRERGRLVIAGRHREEAADLPFWNRRGIDVINAHEPSLAVCMEGMREAVAAVDSGLIDPAPLYTHWLTLERLDEAMRLCRDRPEGFMKALIRC